MALNYTSYNTALTLAEFFAAIIAAGTFGTTSIWDSTTETTATVGDITLTKGASNITVSDGELSFTFGSSSNTSAIIAATENALMCKAGNTIFALGKNTANKWGAVLSNNGTTIAYLIADGLPSAGFRPSTNTFVPQTSTVNTQLIDLSTAYGDFTFTDIFFVLISPSISYDGKMTMNEEKYVQLHCLAMVYTD